jgi:trans-2,3-dihydro-3-hydroxyanthranilate isomerase
MRYDYHTLDVFTDRVFGGNPLAVFPRGEGLDGATMQRIARELNLSETVFVLPPDGPGLTRTIRIFTPGLELPFAGHPTVGTAMLVAELDGGPEDGEVNVVLGEGVGPVPVRVTFRGGRAVDAELTTARVPHAVGGVPSRAALAAMLSLEPDDVVETPLAPAGYTAGVPYLMVPVRDLGAVARARLDSARWQALVDGGALGDVFVVAPEGELPGSTHRARMFAPAAGIPEDPATGSAAAALAGYLAAHLPAGAVGTLRWTVEQGFEMGRPSILRVEADRAADGSVTAVRVGGGAVRVGEGWLDVPVG